MSSVCILREKWGFISLLLPNNKTNYLLDLVILEGQQGFKGHRPSQEEVDWTGVFASADVSQHAPQTLQQERQGEAGLLISFLI